MEFLKDLYKERNRLTNKKSNLEKKLGFMNGEHSTEAIKKYNKEVENEIKKTIECLQLLTDLIKLYHK